MNRFNNFAFRNRFFFRHHRFRNFAFFGAGVGLGLRPYYYGYDGCWQPVWTGYGYRLVNVCYRNYGYGYGY
jgi:hypothetical protein